MERINVVLSDRNWIVERCAMEIANRIDNITVSDRPDNNAYCNYYMNYAAWPGYRSASQREVAFFTHLEPSSGARERFLACAGAMDVCVSMSNFYTQHLLTAGAKDVVVASPGVELNFFKPKVRIGVVGRTYETGRKSQWILEDLLEDQRVEWIITGIGWPNQVESQVSDLQMERVYRGIDYLLVTGAYEGGPMPVLESLASGVPVIAPAVGFVSEYPHVEYAAEDPTSLRLVIENIIREREAAAAVFRRSVQGSTWETWARAHTELFARIAIADGRRPVNGKGRQSCAVNLVLHGEENTLKGGPSTRVAQLDAEARKRGWSSKISVGQLEVKEGLVHVFNGWPATTAVRLIKKAKENGSTVLFSPIVLDYRLSPQYTLLPMMLSEAKNDQEWQRILDTVEDGSGCGNRTELMQQRHSDVSQATEEYRSAMYLCLGACDHVVFLSESEKVLCREWLGREVVGSVVHNGSAGVHGSLNSHFAFESRYGVNNYVLCVGRIEPRKNQLLLVEALRGTGIPVVLIGGCQDIAYRDMVQRRGENVTIIDRLEHGHPILGAAFAGARTFALPSWTEGGPVAAIEAATMGIPLVTGTGGSEKEYFGESAFYCDAKSVASIRHAVLCAYESDQSPGARFRRASGLRPELGLSAMVARTLDVYREIVDQQPRRHHSRPRSSSYVGHVDAASEGCVTGWAVDRSDPARRLAVDVMVDGVTVAVGRASLFRQDLADAGIGDGTCAFRVELPEAAFDDGSHEIVVLIERELRLDCSDRVTLLKVDRQHAFARRYHGSVDRIGLNSVEGWVRDIYSDSNKVPVELRVNGDRVCTGVADNPREDLIAKKVGDGSHAFKLPIPGWLSAAGTDYDVSVGVLNTAHILQRTVRVNFAQMRQERAASIVRSGMLRIGGRTVTLPVLKIGELIQLGGNRAAQRFLIDGWSILEEWGVWSDGDECILAFRIEKPSTQMVLQIRVRPFLPHGLPARRITIEIGENVTQVSTFTKTELRTVNIPFLAQDMLNGKVVVRIRVDGPTCPAELGIGADRRRLGIGLVALALAG